MMSNYNYDTIPLAEAVIDPIKASHIESEIKGFVRDSEITIRAENDTPELKKELVDSNVKKLVELDSSVKLSVDGSNSQVVKDLYQNKDNLPEFKKTIEQHSEYIKDIPDIYEFARDIQILRTLDRMVSQDVDALENNPNSKLRIVDFDTASTKIASNFASDISKIQESESPADALLKMQDYNNRPGSPNAVVLIQKLNEDSYKQSMEQSSNPYFKKIMDFELLNTSHTTLSLNEDLTNAFIMKEMKAAKLDGDKDRQEQIKSAYVAVNSELNIVDGNNLHYEKLGALDVPSISDVNGEFSMLFDEKFESFKLDDGATLKRESKQDLKFN